MNSKQLFPFLLLLMALRGQAFKCLKGTTTKKTFVSPSDAVDFPVSPQHYQMAVPSEKYSCKWEFTFNYPMERILLLNGYHEKDLEAPRLDPRAPRLHYRTNDSYCPSGSDRSWKSVELTTLQVVQLPKRAVKLEVKFNQIGSVVSSDTPVLRVRAMEQGFCHKNVPNFGEKCFISSEVRGTLNEQLASMCEYGEIMRLASFRSGTELKKFVSESQQTLVGSDLEVKSKIPLNLTLPVRIGLFYDRLDNSIYYLDTKDGGLLINLFSDRENLYFNVISTSNISCGTLGIANFSGNSIGIVNFKDCNESLPGLLSFPDSGRNYRCNCSTRAVLDFIGSSRPAQPTESPPIAGTNASDFLIPFIVFLILFVISVVIIIYLGIQNRKYSTYQQATQESRPIMLENRTVP